MLIHLYDCDNTKFPNLALLKLSAWHKARGDDIVWNQPLFGGDLNYSSRVFTWSNNPPIGDYKMGGWVDSPETLPEEVEHICPDYHGMDYSIGFLSRGCIRKCSFCIVHDKEGDIRPHSKPSEFIRHKKAVLIDNNWLASPRFGADVDWLVKNGIGVDFNQGLDARLVDEKIAKHLCRIRWVPYIRFACDSKAQIKAIKRTVELLHKHGYPKGKDIFVYTLITDDLNESFERIMFVKNLHERMVPFGMPYRDNKGKIPIGSNKIQLFADDLSRRRIGKQIGPRELARWVNHKAIFKTVKWENYKG